MILTVVNLLLTIQNLLAQNGSDQVEFKHLTSADGLASNQTTCIQQDKNGFMWIGTKEGLSRYDGLHFINYFQNPADPAHSLSGNLVNGIFAHHQFLFISTNHGISVFDIDKNEFTNDVLKDSRINYQSRELFNFMVNSGGDWYAGGEVSLLRLREDFSVSTDLSEELRKIDNMQMRDFLQPTTDNLGNLYFASCGDMAYYSPQSGSMHKATSPPNNIILSLPGSCHTASPLLFNEKIIFSIWGANPLMGGLNSEWSQFQSLKLNGPDPVYNGTTIHVTKEGENIWFAREDGLYKMNIYDGDLKQLSLNSSKGSNVSCYHLYFEGEMKNMWIATDDGVFYSNNASPGWSEIALPSGSIAIAVAAQDIAVWNEEAWFNVNVGDDIRLFRVRDTHLDSVLIDGLSDGIRSVNVWDNNELFVGGWKDGVIFNRGTNTTKPISWLPDKFKGLPIVKMLRDRHDNVWISFGHYHGILRYNVNTGQQTHFVKSDSLKEGQRYCPIPSAFDMTEDNSGNIWMVRSKLDGKIIKWNRSQDAFEELNPSNAKETFLNYNGESYCVASEDEAVWFAVMREGLFRYDIKSNTIEQFTRNEGLISNDIFALEIDHNGVIWLGTSQGLNAFKYADRTNVHFNVDRGLPSDEFGVASAFDAANNKMYFTCNGHLIVFNPLQLLKPTPFSKLFLTDVRVEGNHVGIVPRNFGPGENHIDFMFTAVDMNFASGFEYRYRLEGLETEWNESGKNKTASYANIPAGEYALMVSVKSNGIWSEPSLLYKFVLPQIFYKTYWFIILMSLLFCLVVYAAYRYRIQRIKQLESMRNRISRDLHDDIGSALSSIRILSGQHRYGNVSASDTLSSINKTSQRMLDNMDDIIWAIQPENDTGEQLLIRMREYASEVIEAAGIEYIIDFDERIELRKFGMNEKRNVYLIFKEAVNNAVKYSAAKKIILKFLLSGHGFAHLIIQDDGTGFEESLKPSGNGLRNMRKRAEELSATINIQSAKNQGTTVELKMPMKP